MSPAGIGPLQHRRLCWLPPAESLATSTGSVRTPAWAGSVAALCLDLTLRSLVEGALRGGTGRVPCGCLVQVRFRNMLLVVT